MPDGNNYGMDSEPPPKKSYEQMTEGEKLFYRVNHPDEFRTSQAEEIKPAKRPSDVEFEGILSDILNNSTDKGGKLEGNLFQKLTKSKPR